MIRTVDAQTLYSVWEGDHLVVATTSNFDAHQLRIGGDGALVVHEQEVLIEKPGKKP